MKTKQLPKRAYTGIVRPFSTVLAVLVILLIHCGNAVCQHKQLCDLCFHDADIPYLYTYSDQYTYRSPPPGSYVGTSYDCDNPTQEQKDGIGAFVYSDKLVYMEVTGYTSSDSSLLKRLLHHKQLKRLDIEARGCLELPELGDLSESQIEVLYIKIGKDANYECSTMLLLSDSIWQRFPKLKYLGIEGRITKLDPETQEKWIWYHTNLWDIAGKRLGIYESDSAHWAKLAPVLQQVNTIKIGAATRVLKLINDYPNIKKLEFLRDMTKGTFYWEERDSLWRAIGDLKYVENLYVSFYRGQDSLPADLGRLHQLKELRIDFDTFYNSAIYDVPVSLWQLPNLERLSIVTSRFLAQIPIDSIRLPKIQQVILYGTTLSPRERQKLLQKIPNAAVFTRYKSKLDTMVSLVDNPESMGWLAFIPYVPSLELGYVFPNAIKGNIRFGNYARRLRDKTGGNYKQGFHMYHWGLGFLKTPQTWIMNYNLHYNYHFPRTKLYVGGSAELFVNRSQIEGGRVAPYIAPRIGWTLLPKLAAIDVWYSYGMAVTNNYVKGFPQMHQIGITCTFYVPNVMYLFIPYPAYPLGW